MGFTDYLLNLDGSDQENPLRISRAQYEVHLRYGCPTRFLTDPTTRLARR